jgi:hypothetical protein
MRNRMRWDPDRASGAVGTTLATAANERRPEPRTDSEIRDHTRLGQRLLGQILVDAGAIGPQILEKALREQAAEGGHRLLGEVLASRGWAGHDVVTRALKLQAAESVSCRTGDPGNI